MIDIMKCADCMEEVEKVVIDHVDEFFKKFQPEAIDLLDIMFNSGSMHYVFLIEEGETIWNHISIEDFKTWFDLYSDKVASSND